MHQQIILIIIALMVVLMFIYTFRQESFTNGCEDNSDCSNGQMCDTDSGKCVSLKSRDCDKFPDDPVCQVECKVNSDCPKGYVCQDNLCNIPSKTVLSSCAPSDGRWNIPDQDAEGRSKLNSPCCQPPDYKLAQNYSTCDNYQDESNSSIRSCMQNCCAFATDQARFYDLSWYPMARCGCSLWCHNKTVPHFSKWGTAQHYITGDIAEARTNDAPNFIDPTGQVSYQTFRHRKH